MHGKTTKKGKRSMLYFLLKFMNKLYALLKFMSKDYTLL